MNRVRITVSDFCWGAMHYPKGTEMEFADHVADMLIQTQKGELVETKVMQAEEEKPAPAPKPKRRYKRRDMQAEQ